MALASRQIKRELNRIAETKLKEGFIPTMEQVISELNDFHRKVTVGMPSFKGRMQEYRKKWDIDAYNNNISEIYDDLNNLYDEMVGQFTIVLKNFDFNDAQRKKLMHEIKEVDSKMNDLLLLANNVEGYIYSVHDYFIDRTKIDLGYTDCEINTAAGAVTLKESKRGILKLDLSHYYDVGNVAMFSEQQYANKIVSNTLYPGSKYGYAFSDINTAWSQRIVTREAGKLEVSFIIELNPRIDDETAISRIEMVGHFTNPVYVEPLWSVDNVNFKALPISDQDRRKEMTENRLQIWNIPETRMQYVKFIIAFNQEDDVLGTASTPQYLYDIGFKDISLYEMAYVPESNLYSKGYTVSDPAEDTLTVDKVSLVAQQETPVSTNIRHYVSLGSPTTSNPTEYDWVEISPINSPTPAYDQVVDFRHVTFLNSLPLIEWDSGTYGTPVETNNGISFYEVSRLDNTPLKGTATMYRGISNWNVITVKELERIAIYDESHTFSSGNTGTESTTLSYPDFTVDKGDGLIRGSVRVKSSAGKDPDVTFSTPNDYTVSYSNHVITRKKDSTMRSDGATIYVDYQYDKETTKSTEYTAYVYIINQDGLILNMVPFTPAEIEAGQFLKMDNEDISASNEITFTPGWHKVVTTAQPRSASDRFYSVNDNKYLYQVVYKMYAFGDKLQEVSWFNLKHNTKLLDHSRYAIADVNGDGTSSIVVNYEPQATTWASSSDELLCSDGNPEKYELTYKYISTENDTIYYRAQLSRENLTDSDITPMLNGYTLRIGY